MNRKIFSIVLASIFFTSCSEGQFLKDESVGEINNSSDIITEDSSNSNNSNKAENSSETSKDAGNNEEVKKDEFNIIFYIDDIIYKSLQVKPGETPIVDDPVKEDDDTYRYEFLKWSPEITPASEDTFYFAIFNKIKKQFKIDWVVNGQVYTEYYDKGEIPSYPFGNPNKPTDDKAKYIFDGWNPEIKEVTEDATYIAFFKEMTKGYVVSFVSDGEIIHEADFDYGETPFYDGPTPTKPPIIDTTYVFIKWNPSFKPVINDTIYVAEFKSEVRVYKVQFKVGYYVKTYYLEYNSNPVYGGNLIDKNNKVIIKDKTYEFKGWNPNITSVTSDTRYTAILKEVS